jgi:hypothetical protein
LSSRAGISQTAGIISALVVIAIVVFAFVPFAAVARSSVVTYSTSTAYTSYYTTSSVYTSYPVSSFTSLQTNTVPTTENQQVYSLSDYTLNCNTYTYESALLNQGWNVQVSYAAGDTITVYLFNSAEFSSFQSGGSPTSEASQTGQSSGSFGYNVPLTDTYYLVWDNNLHTGLFCVGGEKVTVTSSTGTASYQTTQETVETVTAYSTSTSYSTSYRTSTSYSTSTYTTSSTTTTTKKVGWVCYLFGC